MTGIDYEKSIVSFVCWKQMRGELYRGMISMAMMLRNRAEAGWFEGSIYNNAIKLGTEMGMDWSEFPDSREPQFQAMLQAIDGIYTGTIQDKIGGAAYYAHKSSEESIVGEITANIGQYVFFRGPA
jgi:hypothetical protein